MAPKKTSAITLFVNGLVGPFRAWQVASDNKGIKKYFFIPFILNLILLCGIFYLSYIYIYPFIQGIVPQGDVWYLKALKWIITPMLLIILAIVIVLLYSITGNIITAPFNDLLSAKVEKILSGSVPNFKSSFIKDIVRMSMNVIKLLFLLINFYIVIFLLNFIPVLGSIIYSILSFLGTTFFLGFQFFDFPLERRQLNFGDKFKVLWKKKFMVMGVGAGFFVISIIPVFGFLGLNLGAIAATVLFIDYIKPELDEKMSIAGGNLKSITRD